MAIILALVVVLATTTIIEQQKFKGNYNFYYGYTDQKNKEQETEKGYSVSSSVVIFMMQTYLV